MLHRQMDQTKRDAALEGFSIGEGYDYVGDGHRSKGVARGGGEVRGELRFSGVFGTGECSRSVVV